MQLESSESRALIDCHRSGDRRSFEQLFERHREYLKTVVGMRVSGALQTRIDPSDVVQEAHLEAFRRSEEFFAQ